MARVDKRPEELYFLQLAAREMQG